MSHLDMSTIIYAYLISNAICMGMMGFLYIANKNKSSGTGFWLADFIMQFFGVLLVALRGRIPDLLSMTGSNTLIVGGTFLLLEGLGRFTNQRIKQYPNFIYLIIFAIVHSYFIYINPNLAARNINTSLGLAIACGQCVWMLMKNRSEEIRKNSKVTAIVLAAFVIISFIRIYIEFTQNKTNDFFQSGFYESLIVLIFQMLFIILTLSLFLMVNRRLIDHMEKEIIQRKITEKELKLSEEKFSVAFHSQPDAILIAEMETGKIIEVNEGFHSLLGYTREESIGKTMAELKIWAIHAGQQKFAGLLRKKGNILNHQGIFRKKSDEIFPGLISSGMIRIRNKNCLLSVIKDISEQKKAEQEIHSLNINLERRVKERTAELQASNQELEAFAYSVSHDLRAPLRALNGFSEVLIGSYSQKLDEQGRHYLERILRATKDMGLLIDALLDLSRVTRQRMKREIINLSVISKSITEELKTLNPGRKISIRIEKNMPIEADASLMEIVMRNLISNAFKFTSKNEQTEIFIGRSDHDNESVFFVKDNGTGFDMAYANKLFEPFQRLHNKEEYPGSGIGLASVKRIITRHGGRVWAEAEEKRGATFYFTIGGNK
jgi:PAS domain S-box-containing protein